MISQEKEDLLERVMLDKVTDAEKQQFNAWMNEDATLRERFEFRQRLRQQTRSFQRNELNQQFGKWRRETLQESTPVGGVVRWPRLSWAAAAACVLLAGWWIGRSVLLPKSQLVMSRDTTSGRPVKQTPKPIIISNTQSPLLSQPPVAFVPEAHIPLYENQDNSLAIAKGNKPMRSIPVRWHSSTVRQYQFNDTLALYLPNLEWKGPWKLLYNPEKDEYWLTAPRTKYLIVNGLDRKQTLEKVTLR